MEQILMSLMTNALEATPSGGGVSVTTRAYDPHNGSAAVVSVVVEDMGEGLARDLRDRVFEPFFTTKPHGTGIGLPLAKKFVERNGGQIAISDRPGGGAKCEIMFQAGPEATVAAPACQGDILPAQETGNLEARAPDGTPLA
jgi:signal transduction histidine kinase